MPVKFKYGVFIHCSEFSLMNQWIRVREMLLVAEIVKNFPASYGTSNFNPIYITLTVPAQELLCS